MLTMKGEKLQSVLAAMERGEVPSVSEVMECLNDVTDFVTLDSRPGEYPEPLTTCNFYRAFPCPD